MAALSSLAISASFGGLLICPNNTGLTSSLQSISDGNNTSSPLQLSTTNVNVTAFQYNGHTVSISGALTFSGSYSFTGTLTADTSITFPTSGTLATTSQLTLSSISGLGTGVATFCATPTSANLAAALTDE